MTLNKHTLTIFAKDALFIALGLLLILRTGFLGKLIGFFAVLWYGRDLVDRAKALRGGQNRQGDRVERPDEAPRRGQDTPIIDDGKIQVTDLSDAKEVTFEKEQ